VNVFFFLLLFIFSIHIYIYIYKWYSLSLLSEPLYLRACVCMVSETNKDINHCRKKKEKMFWLLDRERERERVVWFILDIKNQMSHIEEEFEKIESENGWNLLFRVSCFNFNYSLKLNRLFLETCKWSWCSNIRQEDWYCIIK
jgi:hypothetical protein